MLPAPLAAMSTESATSRGRETRPAPFETETGPQLIAGLTLRLNLHIASGCSPDECVSLRDVTMIGKLPRYVILVAKDFPHPFANGVLGASKPTNFQESCRHDRAQSRSSARLT